MGKKGRKEYTTYERKLFSLRWEFLRRNKRYIHDVKRCRAASRKMRKADRQERLHEQKAWTLYFMGEYGVACPLDPKMSFLDSQIPLVKTRRNSLRRRTARKTLVKRPRDVLDLSDLRVLYKGAYCLTPDQHVVNVDADGNVNGEPLNAEEIRQQDSIEILIDLEVPVERIIHEVGDIVAKWKEMRSKAAPERKKRARLAEYNRYLSVFDLKNKGASWESIAGRLYKSDVERDDMIYAKAKAKRDYQRCKELIEGGYQQLR